MTPTVDPERAARRIAAARAYVDALVSHDPSRVSLHPECTRTELGLRTGRSGAHISRGLLRAPQFRLIHRISDFTAEVDGHTVSTRFWVHVRPKALGLAAQVTETFVVDEDYRIRKIVARFGVPRRKG
ncbi:hypothetical protein [Gordonia insulae]|uniref:DUF8021 domain-containing protein n=1 Tax=Gordonia insulae TaxID=2420509 RepID=A0A3G8JSK2_9ACTN|nr:hypothetical protein [Gordonia insulae]AZG47893.1 hypothetical protein D7316_04505 [Gordonia insulae]